MLIIVILRMRRLVLPCYCQFNYFIFSTNEKNNNNCVTDRTFDIQKTTNNKLDKRKT